MAIQLRYSITEAGKFEDYEDAGKCIDKFEVACMEKEVTYQYRLRPISNGIVVSVFDDDNKLKGYLYEAE